jgi:hypothetical protein
MKSTEDRNAARVEDPRGRGGKEMYAMNTSKSQDFYVEVPAGDRQRVVRFPVAEGKEARAVQFITNADSHLVYIEFADESLLCFAIEPRLMVRAGYESPDDDDREFPGLEIESYREDENAGKAPAND